MAMPIIHHRAPDFLPVLDSAKKGLQWLYQTKNDVLILCSTGTGGMEGSVTNFLSPGDDVLVINGGKFGERWTKICQAYGMKVEEIVVDWGYAVKPEAVEAAIRRLQKTEGAPLRILICGSLYLAGAVLADQHDEWAIARRYLSEASMTKLNTRDTDPAVTAELQPGT